MPNSADKPVRVLEGDWASCPTVWSARLADIAPGSSEKFHIVWGGRAVEGFVVNLDGRYHAYVNHCVHAGTPLDWWDNEFLSDDGRHVVCGTHGSLFDPHTGRCSGGPCAGGALYALEVRVTGRRVFVTAPEGAPPTGL
jgi:nitrite reductase/ring-hydroxylating ferredoxin subunit